MQNCVNTLLKYDDITYTQFKLLWEHYRIIMGLFLRGPLPFASMLILAL